MFNELVSNCKKKEYFTDLSHLGKLLCCEGRCQFMTSGIPQGGELVDSYLRISKTPEVSHDSHILPLT